MASPNTCESILLLPPIQPAASPCDVEQGTQGFVTQTLGATGSYYDTVTGLIRTYTNPSPFPLIPGSRICVIGDVVQAFDNSTIFTVQYFIDNVAITTVISLNQAMLVVALQFIIEQNITNPNVTITVNSFTNAGLSVTITLETLVAVNEAKVIYTPVGEDQPPFFPSDFTCNIAPPTPSKKKKRSRAGVIQRCPDEIIFKADTSHQQVKYCNQVYNFYGMDAQGLIHYINSSSNIYQRNTEDWWALYI